MRGTGRQAFLAIALALLLICAATPAYAANGAELWLEPSPPDAEGEYTVSALLSADSGAAMLQFAVTYDAQKVECLSTAPGALLAGSSAPTVNSAQPGSVFFAWDALTPLTDGGVLFTMRFKSSDPDAELTIAVDDDFIVADSDFSSIGTVARGCVLSEAAANDAAAASGGAQSGENKGLTLNKNKLKLKPQDSEALSVTGTEGTVIWDSSNESSVTVDGGTLTALSPGSAMITASTPDGELSASCLVSVDEGGAAMPLWLICIAAALAAAAVICLFIIIPRRARAGGKTISDNTEETT